MMTVMLPSKGKRKSLFTCGDYLQNNGLMPDSLKLSSLIENTMASLKTRYHFGEKATAQSI